MELLSVKRRGWLACVAGVKIAEIERVFSHPVALAQCRKFLAAHPAMRALASYDTAGSVKQLAEMQDRRAAAIASEAAARYFGAEILEAGIEDNPENFTRFFLVRRGWWRARSVSLPCCHYPLDNSGNEGRGSGDRANVRIREGAESRDFYRAGQMSRRAGMRLCPFKTFTCLEAPWSGISRPLRNFHVEFSSFSAYAKDADEFVRLSCRGYAGWRRDEWAYSPLFIWGKCSGLEADFSSCGCLGFWGRNRADGSSRGLRGTGLPTGWSRRGRQAGLVGRCGERWQ